MSRINLYLFCIALSVATVSSPLFGMQKLSKVFSKKSTKSFKHSFNKAPFFNTWQQQRSLFHYTELKGIEDAFRCEKLKDKASPLRGITLVESDLLKNLYEFGPEKNAMVELINHKKNGLFNLLINDLRHTQINPACALTPELTAFIVAESIRGTLDFPEVKEEIVTLWRENYHRVRPGKKISKKAIEDQFDAIVNAQQENNGDDQERLFPKDFGISLMLAHLYRKGTKQDVLDYLAALSKHFPERMNSKAIVRATGLTYAEKKLNKHYSYLEGINYKAFLKDRTKAVAAFIHNAQKLNLYPPLALQGSYSYESSITRPDCCETGIRNLCNLMLASNNGTFDLSLLPKSIKPHQKCIEFYTLFSKFDIVRNPVVGQAWMNVVSGHKGVKYDQGNYEIYSSLDNILAVMNILFQVEANNFEELGNALSTKTRVICLKPQQDNLAVTIQAPEHSFVMMLEINPGCHTATKLGSHAHDGYTSDGDEPSAWYIDDFIKVLKPKSSQFPLHLSPLMIKLAEKRYNGPIKNKGLTWKFVEMYSEHLSDSNVLVSNIVLLSGAYNRSNKQKESLKNALMALCKKVPQQDMHLMRQAFGGLLETDLIDNETWFRDFVESNPVVLINAILEKTKPFYHKYLLGDFQWDLLDKALYTYLDQHKEIHMSIDYEKEIYQIVKNIHTFFLDDPVRAQPVVKKLSNYLAKNVKMHKFHTYFERLLLSKDESLHGDITIKNT